MLLELVWARRRVDRLTKAAGAATGEERAAHEAHLDTAQEAIARLERDLADHRQILRRQGIAPPPLAPDLVYLDNGSQEGGDARDHNPA